MTCMRFYKSPESFHKKFLEYSVSVDRDTIRTEPFKLCDQWFLGWIIKSIMKWKEHATWIWQKPGSYGSTMIRSTQLQIEKMEQWIMLANEWFKRWIPGAAACWNCSTYLSGETESKYEQNKFTAAFIGVNTTSWSWHQQHFKGTYVPMVQV